MSNLIDHARRELDAANVEPDIAAHTLAIVGAFASYGHSGGSAAATRHLISRLLEFKPLTPINNDPSDWIEVGPSVWQCRRNSEAFSGDGGQTYTLLSERRSWVPFRLRRAPIFGRIWDGPIHKSAASR